MPVTPSGNDNDFDPILLRRLYERLMELRREDRRASADEVLEELHPSIRATYQSPLMDMVSGRAGTRGDAGDHSQEGGNSQGTVRESDAADHPDDRASDTGPSAGPGTGIPETGRTASQSPTSQFTGPVTNASELAGATGGMEEWTVDLPTGFKAEPVDLPPPTRPSRRSRTSDDEKLPDYVGKFRVKGELGRGANGVVYLGFDEELERNVAIKLSLVSGAKLQERLRVEASKAAAVEADGIVPVYHIGATDEGAVYIVQKYIEGTTLRSLLKNGGPLSPARGVALLREISVALQPAHLRDILHRDLKPDNILIDQAGKAWISDFGLAISEEEQQGRRSELAGTPAYMSPEQIKGKIEFLDPRSDIWALGVIFYEALTGKLPFNGKNRKSLTEQICERDPRPMQQRAPQQLTPEMNAVFEKCCAKQPSDRYASINELVAALDDLIDDGLSEHNIEGRYISTFGPESLFAYDTTTGRDSPTIRGHDPTLRTERIATSRATVRRSSIEERALPAAGMSTAMRATIGAIGALATVAALTATYLLWQTEGGGSAEGGGQTSVVADGSSDAPWIVASGNLGSHPTIQAAVDQAGEGDFIRIDSQDNVESLDIRKKLTLVGGLDQKAATIRSNRSVTININCPDPEQWVTLKNLTIRGLGGDSEERFNTIDVLESGVVIVGCEIESRSQNCIKSRGGTIDLSESVFQSVSGSNAVSVSDHSKAVVKNCSFFDGGVELTRGGALIEGCQFQKGIGVSTHLANGRPVYINDCRFDECYVGISVNNAVEVLVGSDCQFNQCDWGAMLHSIDQQPSGLLDLKSAKFVGCKRDAVYVAGGRLEVRSECRFENCASGIFVENGDAKLVGTEISGGGIGVSLGVKPKDQLGRWIIPAGKAEVVIEGGQIRNAAFGINVMHDQGSCDVRATEFTKNSQCAISYTLGQLSLREVEISGGEKGVFAWSDRSEGRGRVDLIRCRFVDLNACEVETAGQVDVHLVDCKLSGRDTWRLLEAPPSSIVVGTEEP